MLRVVTLFSGYDSQCMALDRLGVEYELVAWAEIDRYAIAAHNAVYPQWKDRNVGDVSKVDWSKVEGPVDLLTYSSPCQDFSQAGLMRGGEEGSGTRSSLLWEVKRAIEVLKPRYLLMENVKNLVSKKFIGLFSSWLRVLEEEGYESQWKVLNAKDFGVPQNRERVFVVSGKSGFEFPEGKPLERRLGSVLEREVAEKYWLKKEKVEAILKHCERKQLEGCVYGLSRSRDKSGKVVKRNINPYVNCLHTGVGGHCRENMEVYVLDDGDVRKLTPRECFRLMDVSEGDIDRIMAAGISDSQMYKMAWNSIVVAVLVAIFNNLLYGNEIRRWQQGVLF